MGSAAPVLMDAADLLRLQALQHRIEELKAIRHDWPIARWQAWHSDAVQGCVSQRDALGAPGELVTCFFGGNRSGKTELMRALIVAYALGSDHPAVQVWAMLNGFDLTQIPTGPGRCWIVALSSNDSKRYHRKQILKLLPQGARIRAWNMAGRGEAHLEVDVPGYDDPAEIYFKSADQGARGMQGDECRCIGFDEEPDLEVFEEAEMRVGAEPLRMLMSMTPLKGLTWVYDRFVEPSRVDGVQCHWFDALDNPHLPAATKEQLRRKYMAMTDQQVAARRFGQFLTIEGRVFSSWDRSVHVVDPFDIPPSWPRVRVMDFGIRNPAAVLWGALSPDDQLVIYREHYQAGWSLGRHAARILEFEGWRTTADPEKSERKADGRMWYRPPCEHGGDADCERCGGSGYLAEHIGRAWADPTGIQQILDMRVHHGLAFRPAQNAIDAGLNDVVERLARPALTTTECQACSGAGRSEIGGVIHICERCKGAGARVTEWGEPGLVVFRGLSHFVREIEGYVHPKRRGKPDPSEHPVKRADHLMDALRYMCRGVRRGSVKVG